ncbi:MAG: diacylglycerol kinase family protein [Terriglobales bacterium]
MRAAAIVGPGISSRYLEKFKATSDVAWVSGVPNQSSDADAIVIFGGDGTIHRQLSRLVALQLPVLIVPCGSGNDFARALNLRHVHDALDAWQQFSRTQANTRKIDLGLIRESDKNICHYFCCAGGVGLDGEIARRANALPRWLRANGGYALSLLPALANFAAISMNINSSNLSATCLAYVAVFANAPYYGGGMKIAPRARLDDGKLDLCIIGDMAKLKLLTLFPTIYFGKHLKIPRVEYTQTPSLTLTTEIPYPVYADGEYVCETPIEVGIAAKALPVIVP